ncbi:MAG: hypothetical protein U5R30_16160 [Deltaproteobacteria bacterium]|nr:hypothetical protein [Deltaproteobacteria bacterium]
MANAVLDGSDAVDAVRGIGRRPVSGGCRRDAGNHCGEYRTRCAPFFRCGRDVGTRQR